MKNIHRLAVLPALLIGSTCLGQENLLVNGGFEQLYANGQAVGWKMNATNLAVVDDPDEPGNRVLKSNRRPSDPGSAAVQRIPIDPSWSRLGIRARLKATSLVLGEEGWQKPRVGLEWLNAEGQAIGYPPNPSLEADSDWANFDLVFPVIPNAAFLNVVPGNFGREGEVWFDDLEIIADPELPATAITHAMPEGTFEPTAQQPLAGWTLGDGAQIIEEDGNHFLRLSRDEPGRTSAEQLFRLDPAWSSVTVSVRMRASSLVTGGETW